MKNTPMETRISTYDEHGVTIRGKSLVDDIIGELTIALKHGLTVGQLGAVIHPYPTTAEAIKQASEARLKAGFAGWKKSLVRRIVERAGASGSVNGPIAATTAS
mgnify:CR=1 FL=1